MKLLYKYFVIPLLFVCNLYFGFAQVIDDTIRDNVYRPQNQAESMYIKFKAPHVPNPDRYH